MKAARILLLDENEIARKGLRSVLENREEWEVVGEAAPGREALSLLDELKPDVVVVDAGHPDRGGTRGRSRDCEARRIYGRGGAHVACIGGADSHGLGDRGARLPPQIRRHAPSRLRHRSGPARDFARSAARGPIRRADIGTKALAARAGNRAAPRERNDQQGSGELAPHQRQDGGDAPVEQLN